MTNMNRSYSILWCKWKNYDNFSYVCERLCLLNYAIEHILLIDFIDAATPLIFLYTLRSFTIKPLNLKTDWSVNIFTDIEDKLKERDFIPTKLH